MTDRPHRAPLTLVADGLRRVWRAPAILCGVWAVTTIVALRPAAVLHRAIVGDLGSSMAASSAASGVNWTWWQEFTARQPAFAETFQPHIIGFASVLTNASAFVSAGLPGPLIASTGAAYVLIWLFLLGGILDRYARGRRLGAHGFFAASGVFFFRFLRLAVLAGIAWVFVFRRAPRLAVRRVLPAGRRVRSRWNAQPSPCTPPSRCSSCSSSAP